MDRAAAFLRIAGVRQWWDVGGKTNLTRRFVEFLESTHSKMTCWSSEVRRGFFERDEPVARKR